MMLSASFTLDTHKDILMGYFAALAVLECCVASVEDVPCAPQLALLNAVLQFMVSVPTKFISPNSGHCMNIQTLCGQARHSCHPTSSRSRCREATNVNGHSYYSHGLDVLSWLQGPDEALPPVEYLTSIPISFPLIGLTQLIQCLVCLL